MAGTLFVVATPIGNLEDISARALRILREAALIAAEDTRRTAQLLARYGIPTPTTSLHEHNETAKAAALLGRLQAGESVALVSDAGTPTVADPGARLIAAAIESGIRVEAIPGPSAVTTALSASGFSVDGFSFLGFPPTQGTARRAWFDRLAACAPCAVFYEAPHRIIFTLQDLHRIVGDVPIAVGRELTKRHEEILRGTVSTVLGQLEHPIGEFTVVALIGQPTEHRPSHAPPTAANVFHEFGRITQQDGLTRRQAVARLSRSYGLSAKVVYDLIEKGKASSG